MKDSIIFYLSHYEVVKQLDNEQLGKLYRALFELALGNEPKVDEDIKIPFGFIKNQMDLDINKYNGKCLKNRENGKLGGRPKKNATKEIEKTEKANGFFENPNDNENDNENENDNDNGDDISHNTLYDYIEENFGRTLAPLEYQEIITWNDSELTKYAIKQAILNGKYNIKYISRILSAYERENIKTVQQAQEREREYEVMQKERRNKKEVKKEPIWFNKEIKALPATLDEQNGMKKMLEEFGKEVKK